MVESEEKRKSRPASTKRMKYERSASDDLHDKRMAILKKFRNSCKDLTKSHQAIEKGLDDSLSDKSGKSLKTPNRSHSHALSKSHDHNSGMYPNQPVVSSKGKMVVKDKNYWRQKNPILRSDSAYKDN